MPGVARQPVPSARSAGAQWAINRHGFPATGGAEAGGWLAWRVGKVRSGRQGGDWILTVVRQMEFPGCIGGRGVRVVCLAGEVSVTYDSHVFHLKRTL